MPPLLTPPDVRSLRRVRSCLTEETQRADVLASLWTEWLGCLTALDARRAVRAAA